MLWGSAMPGIILRAFALCNERSGVKREYLTQRTQRGTMVDLLTRHPFVHLCDRCVKSSADVAGAEIWDVRKHVPPRVDRPRLIRKAAGACRQSDAVGVPHAWHHSASLRALP
jgi:hypothetical protein